MLEGWYRQPTGRFFGEAPGDTAWFHTRGVIDAFLSGRRSRAHTMFGRPAKVFCERVQEHLSESITASDAFCCFAFFNYFQRPEQVRGGSFRSTELDKRYAREITAQIITALEPACVIFLSKKAQRAFGTGEAVCHPTAPGWWKPEGAARFSLLLERYFDSREKGPLIHSLREMRARRDAVLRSLFDRIAAYLTAQGFMVYRTGTWYMIPEAPVGSGLETWVTTPEVAAGDSTGEWVTAPEVAAGDDTGTWVTTPEAPAGDGLGAEHIAPETPVGDGTMAEHTSTEGPAHGTTGGWRAGPETLTLSADRGYPTALDCPFRRRGQDYTLHVELDGGLFCGIGLWDGEHLTAPSPAERRLARRNFGLWHPRRKGLHCFYEYCDGPSLDLCHRPTVIENGVNANQFTEICGTLDRIISAIREGEPDL